MVLDLTNTSKYYRFQSEIPDADKRGIFYRKARAHTRVCARVMYATLLHT
jgi:hypothetical protein